MSRSIAAGTYDLQMITNANIDMYAEELATTETADKKVVTDAFATTAVGTKYTVADDKDFNDGAKINKNTVDYATVKEGFINVITAGRDQDDASFTKKVVVPVGEKYLIAGAVSYTHLKGIRLRCTQGAFGKMQKKYCALRCGGGH